MTEEQAKKIDEMYEAFMKSPPGSNEPPLVHRLRDIVKAYDRGNWFARLVLYGLPMLAACGAAIKYLVNLGNHGS